MVNFEDLEIWDHIKGHEGLYKVSSKGKVWSVKTKKILKPVSDAQGYHKVNLYKDKKQKNHRIHRLTALTFYFMDDDGDEDKLIDHIDQDKTNNNLLSLRFCTDSENKCNVGLYQNNTTGYKGVNWSKSSQKWRARIKINGEHKSLGYFNTKEEAYNAYKEASKELHGDYGYAP